MDAFTVVYLHTKAMQWGNGKENKSQCANGWGLSIIIDPPYTSSKNVRVSPYWGYL